MGAIGCGAWADNAPDFNTRMTTNIISRFMCNWISSFHLLCLRDFPGCIMYLTLRDGIRERLIHSITWKV